MKVCGILVLLALSGFASASVALRWLSVPVGHYNPLIRQQFDLRYFVNDEFFVPGGPIFIYVAGGFEVYNDFIERGAMFEIARDTGGLLFALEHRYFGESRPTGNVSTQNMAFLTVNQAVADVGEFVAFVKENYSEARDSRVILWGRGYGGALAVWARHRFHHLVDGVWASSAPINAIVENPEFMRNTAQTIRQIGGDECLSDIRDAFAMIEDGIRLRNTSYIESRLKLCSPINIDAEEDIARLFYGIASDIGLKFVTNARYPDIDDKCTIMRGLDTPENPPENPLDGFARWYIDDFNRNLDCMEFSNEVTVNLYTNTDWDTISTIAGRRQTLWLQCTQLGQFATSNNGQGHPFGTRFELPFFRQWCARVFGEELFSQNFMEETIGRTNLMFGGLDPQIFNVFFTHGEMDPKRTLGPNEDINENSPAVVMALQSFSRDLGSPSDTDYAVLLETKQQARELIFQWLQIGNATEN